jgi:hypothetical protein
MMSIIAAKGSTFEPGLGALVPQSPDELIKLCRARLKPKDLSRRNWHSGTIEIKLEDQLQLRKSRLRKDRRGYLAIRSKGYDRHTSARKNLSNMWILGPSASSVGDEAAKKS